MLHWFNEQERSNIEVQSGRAEILSHAKNFQCKNL